MMRIGIDLGGTKIEAAALDDQNRELIRTRVPTPRGDYRGTLAAIAGLIRKVEAELGQTGTIGIGMPGAVSPASGRIKNANSTWLNGTPFDRDLAETLGRPIRAQNDANCLAVSEATDGAAMGAAIAYAIILGTGCGSGIAIQGRAWSGANAIAGELGHNPLPWPKPEELPGRQCYCGKVGCIETWVSGTGFENDYEDHNGVRLPAVKLHEMLVAEDAAVMASFERYKDRLARTIAHVINILDPDVIVLGGGMSNVDRLYAELPELVDDWTFSDKVVTPIRKARHGDSSGVRGAACLWTVDEAAEAISAA